MEKINCCRSLAEVRQGVVSQSVVIVVEAVVVEGGGVLVVEAVAQVRMQRTNTVGKSRFSRALLSLSSSLGSSLQGLHVGSLGSLHLRSVLGSHGQLRVEDWSHSVIDRSYGQPGVRHAEAEIIRNIFHSLEVTVGVNIGVGWDLYFSQRSVQLCQI